MEDTMDKAKRSALALNELIDITTIGRNSGNLRRIEIWRWSQQLAISVPMLHFLECPNE